ncbi:MAG: S9 family peptidase [Verrucomicrobiales bacterium]|nr:S9 family peptidase [Verrucomicrobiales bacterium]
MKPTRLVALSWAFLMSLGLGSRSSQSAEIPVANLFRDFEFEEMALSPDGKTLAMTGPQKGRRNIAVFDLETRQPRWLTKLGDREAYDIRWFGDRIVFRMVKNGFDMGAICAIDRDGTDQQVLIHSLEHQSDGLVTYLEEVSILSGIPGNDDLVLVEREEIGRYTSARSRGVKNVHRLNLRNGICALEAKNPGDVIAWYPDLTGKIRAALSSDGEKVRLIYRDDTDTPWRTLTEWGARTSEVVPVGFAADNRNLIVSASGNRNTSGLYVYQVDSKTLDTNIWHHEWIDADLPIIDPYTGLVVGVHYDDTRPRSQFFEEDLKRIQFRIDRVPFNTSNRLLNYSRDRKRFLYSSQSDRNPGHYYLFDFEQKKFDALGAKTTRIRPADMSAQIATNYLARDGLRIPAYLTLPAGQPTSRLPLVVMVHGGPWSRVHWGFDREVQFFASRGYAVLQPNYRGSTGYGMNHFRAGIKQWGLKMQDDITDGVHWAIQQGIADPARVVIYGASYGGYSTMMGLATTPELYRCGINYVGVTDIVGILGYVSSRLPARYAAFQSIIIGDLETERARLEATSPVNVVDKIRAPVFLAYGELDSRVPIQQGRRLARELKRLDKPFEMIVKKDEGHGFFIEKNRIELYEAIDKFLKKHVP